jgi:hypothetical protein
MREFEIILFQTQNLSIKVVSFIKNILKRFAKRLCLNFTLNWSLYYV